MRRRATQVAQKILAGLLVLGVLACGSLTGVDRGTGAIDVVRQYFTAVTSGEPDYGWSLLHPHTRQEWPYEEYERTVVAADWSRFRVTATAAIHCNVDDPCLVCLEIPGGAASVPPFLHATENRVTDGIIFDTAPRECGNAVVGVVVGLLPGEPTTVSIGRFRTHADREKDGLQTPPF
jgi:hypothetical protein